MALSPDERKKLLGHGGLARAAKLAGRARNHTTYVNQGLRRDKRVERVIARLIIEKHPNLDASQIWPSEESRDVAGVSVGESATQ